MIQYMAEYQYNVSYLGRSHYESTIHRHQHMKLEPNSIHDRSFPPFIAMMVSLNDESSGLRNIINSDTKELLRIKKDAAASLIQD